MSAVSAKERMDADPLTLAPKPRKVQRLVDTMRAQAGLGNGHVLDAVKGYLLASKDRSGQDTMVVETLEMLGFLAKYRGDVYAENITEAALEILESPLDHNPPSRNPSQTSTQSPLTPTPSLLAPLSIPPTHPQFNPMLQWLDEDTPTEEEENKPAVTTQEQGGNWVEENGEKWVEEEREGEEGEEDGQVNEQTYDDYLEDNEWRSKDPRRDAMIDDLISNNQDLIGKIKMNRKRKRTLVNNLRMLDNPTRNDMKGILKNILCNEITPEESRQMKEKKDRKREKVERNALSSQRGKEQAKRERKKQDRAAATPTRGNIPLERRKPATLNQNIPEEDDDEMYEDGGSEEERERRLVGALGGVLGVEERVEEGMEENNTLSLSSLSPSYKFIYFGKGMLVEATQAVYTLGKRDAIGIDVQHLVVGGMALGMYMEMSTESQGYIFNLQHLAEGAFKEAVQSILTSPKIIKVGYSLDKELEALCNTLELSPKSIKSTCSLEDKLFIAKTPTLLNLSRIVERVLGKPLNTEKLKKITAKSEIESYDERKQIMVEALACLMVYRTVYKTFSVPLPGLVDRCKDIGMDKEWTIVVDVACPCALETIKSTGMKYRLDNYRSHTGTP